MRGFIFDMDGCLLDSISIWRSTDEFACELAGIPFTKELHDHITTLTLEEAAAFFHEQYGVMESAADMVKAVLGHMLGFYESEVEAKRGALDFVRAVYGSGLPLCVLSSSPQSFLQAGLTHTGLLSFFDDRLVISAEDRGWAKRKPDTFDKVCALLGTDPSETWLFDDSWYALARAREAGLRTVGVFSDDNCGTHEDLARHSEIVVDDFTQLDPRDFLP